MKIGLSAGSFPANMSIPQGLRLAKRSGFDCVELDISEAGYLTPESSDQAVSFLRQSVENMSLYVGSVWAPALESYPIATADEHGLEIARRCLEIASLVGSRTLCVPSGPIEPPVERDEVLERFARNLKTLCAAAQDFGVDIAVECAANGFIMSAQDAVTLIDAAGCEMAGVCVDTASAGALGTPDEWIRQLGSRLKMVLARDYRTMCNGSSVAVNLLQGDTVDWKEVRRALIDVDYNGVVMAKIPGYNEYGDLGVKHCGESMKRIFGPAAKK